MSEAVSTNTCYMDSAPNISRALDVEVFCTLVGPHGGANAPDCVRVQKAVGCVFADEHELEIVGMR
jgi:hypothetical protein